jgi:Ca2+-binding RTX toxin-like protein
LLSDYDQIEATIDGDPNGDDAAKTASQLHISMMIAIAVLVGAGATEQAASAEFISQMAIWINQMAPNPIDGADETRIETLLSDAATALGVTLDALVRDGAADIIAAFNAAIDAFASAGFSLLEDLAQAGIVAHAANGVLQTATSVNIATIVSTYTGTNLDTAIASATPQDVQGVNGDNTITGTSGADFIEGLGGNDTLNGDAGDDVLDGGEGNDTLNGGDGRDLLRGGPGDDIIDGGQWFSSIDNAGSGDLDRVSYFDAPSAVTVDLSLKNVAQNTGGGGTDTLNHVEGVIGSTYNDTLTGGGNDFIETFRGGGGDDQINGGSGLDRAEYFDATAGVTISLAAGSVNGVASGVGNDTLSSVEDIAGSHFADVYDATGFNANSTNSGSNGAFNSFRPGGGDDTIIGNGDTRIDYFNAPHAVTVDLTNRDVNPTTGKIYGGTGVGTDAFSGVNRVRGSQFNDALLGGQQEYGAPGSAEFFDGQAGDDFIFGGSGFDYAQYQAASYVVEGIKIADNASTTLIDESTLTFGISVNLAAGTVTGDAKSFGTDTLREVEGIVGTVLADYYDATGVGASSTNHLSLGVIVDEFEGGAGDDVIIGSNNTRVSYRSATAGITVDLSVNNDGSGTVTGDTSVGTDTLVGGVASIRGSDFNDTLIGYDNAVGTLQFFDGQGGDDTIDGKGGFDRVTFNQDIDVTQGITVTLTATGTFGSGGILAGTVSGNASEVGNDTLANIESVVGTDFNDVLQAVNGGGAQNFGTLEFEGGSGNDTITGLFVSGTSTRITFNTATDGVTVNFNTTGTAGTNSGTATGDSSVGSDTFSNIRDVRGSIFDDTIVGRYSASGGTGNIDNQFFQGGSGGNDILEGGAGNDTLWGGDSNNTNGTERHDGISAQGFDDIDFVSYAGATGPVTVNLFADTGVIGTTGQTGDFGDASGGNIGTDLLVNIEGVIGSSSGDTLNGGGYFFEAFRGGGGDDIINGGNGYDSAYYADATNGVSISLAGGIVNGVAGGVGTDTLYSIESIRGSSFDDAYNASGFSGSSANAGSMGTYNVFRGSGGNDSIIGNNNTRLDYSDATAGLTIDLTTGQVNGTAAGVGVDTFNGVNSARGTEFDDTLKGGQAAFNLANTSESFIGGGGDDIIDGGAGFDRAIYNLDGNISIGINVHLAAGLVTGDSDLTGTDSLQGIESVIGSVLGDVFDARGFGSGSTNAGSLGTLNEFEGHAGNDTIFGNGNTRVAFYSAQEAVTVDLATGTAIGGASVGTDTFTGVNRVRGSDFGDTIKGDSGANVLEGQGGNDRLEGRAGNDTMTGGSGADTFVFAAGFGNDVITDFAGGAGISDTLELSSALFADAAAVLAAATDVGSNVVITAASAETLTLQNVTKASLNLDDFVIV